MRYLSVAAERVTQETLTEALETAFGGQEGEIMPTLAERWIEQGLERGLEQGLRQGQQQALRESILDLLNIRFDATPSSIVERLSTIEGIDTLRSLHRRAVTAESLAEFEQFFATLF